MNKTISCPYCKYEYEPDSMPIIGLELKKLCQNCGETYEISANFEIVYRTKKK